MGHPKLREMLETILPKKQPLMTMRLNTIFYHWQAHHAFECRQIERVLGKERIILLAIEDITSAGRLKMGWKKSVTNWNQVKYPKMKSSNTPRASSTPYVNP